MKFNLILLFSTMIDIQVSKCNINLVLKIQKTNKLDMSGLAQKIPIKCVCITLVQVKFLRTSKAPICYKKKSAHKIKLSYKASATRYSIEVEKESRKFGHEKKLFFFFKLKAKVDAIISAGLWSS